MPTSQFTKEEKRMLQQALLNYMTTLENLQTKLDKEAQTVASKSVSASIAQLKDLETKLL